MAGELFQAIVDGLLKTAQADLTQPSDGAPQVVSVDAMPAMTSSPRTTLPPADDTFSSWPGSLEPGFGRNGVVASGMTGGNASALAIHADGSYAVAGTSTNDRGRPSITISRFDRSGQPLRTFGKTGCIRLDVTHPPGANNDSVTTAVAIQPDGHIIVAGAAQQPPSAFTFQDIALARVTPDGRLDPSFGAGGWLQLHLAMASAANALLVAQDGRILAGGYVRGLQGGSFQMLLMQTMPNGAPDPSFGNGGFVALPGTADVEQIVCMARLHDDRIIGVARQEAGFDKKFVFFRLGANGQLDPTFANAGRRPLDLGPGDNVLGGLAIQPDGKYVAAGYLNSREYFLLRLLADGSLDPEFGEGGIVRGAFADADGGPSGSSLATAVAVAPNGFIYLGGAAAARSSHADSFACALARFLPTGARDISFGMHGSVLVDLGKGENRIHALALDGEAIVAAGQTASGIALLRFDSRARLRPAERDQVVATRIEDPPRAPPSKAPSRREGGWLDTTFGDGGVVFGDFGSARAEASALVVQSDGAAVIVGTVGSPDDPEGRNLGLFRIDKRGAVDGSFGVSGYKVLDIEGSDNVARAVALQSDGKLVVAGEVLDRQQNIYELALTRFEADGRLDKSFGGGLVLPRFRFRTNSRASAVAVLRDGRILSAGQSTYTRDPDDVSAGKPIPELLGATLFAFARHDANGKPDESFGFGGTAETLMTPGPGAIAHARAIRVLDDGRIVAAGFAGSESPGSARRIVMGRLSADGELDESFSANGILTLKLEGDDERASALSVQGDGKIILAGEAAADPESPQHFMLARLTPDGALDPSFSGSGYVINREFTGVARSVIVLADGRIVAAGSAAISGRSRNGDPVMREQLALVSYLPDGSVDEAFGTGGILVVDLGGDRDGAVDIALDGDGILIAASSRSGEMSELAVVRVHTR